MANVRISRKKPFSTDTRKNKDLRPHPLSWVVEPFAHRPDYVRKSMFGCEAAYLGGRLVLALAGKAEPWNGILCPTERRHHASLQDEFRTLQPHAILRKWLYLSRTLDDFEQTGLEIVAAILSGDRRFGVEPKRS
jgi:hypothetical protein